MGKTIACPKCGHQMKIKDRAQPTEGPIVARPVSSTSIPPKAVVAQPVQPSASPPPSFFPSNDFQPAPSNDWNQVPMPPSLPANYGQASRTNAAPRGNGRLWLWIALGGAGFLFLGVTVSVLAVWWLSGSTQVADSKGGSGKMASGSDVRSSNQSAAGVNKAKTTFPILGPGRPFKDNILLYHVMIPRPTQRALRLIIFIPKGDHAVHSLIGRSFHRWMFKPLRYTLAINRLISGKSALQRRVSVPKSWVWCQDSDYGSRRRHEPKFCEPCGDGNRCQKEEAGDVQSQRLPVVASYRGDFVSTRAGLQSPSASAKEISTTGRDHAFEERARRERNAVGSINRLAILKLRVLDLRPKA